MSTQSPRVLLLGASGLLGGHLLDRLSRSYSTLAVAGPSGLGGADQRVEWLPMRLDAADPHAIGSLLDASRADVVVNATGASPQSAQATLTQVNARFPRALGEAAAERGARVVHMSTDGVFSGARGNYAEDDVPDPADAYGRSKLDGELAAPHLTIRASFFGRSPRGSGLVEWLIAQRGRTVDGFADYRFSGMAAPLLADLFVSAIERALTGVYHVGGDPVTKYDLLCAVSQRLGLDITVRPASRRAIDRTLHSRMFFDAIGRPQPTVVDSIDALTSCGVLSRS